MGVKIENEIQGKQMSSGAYRVQNPKFTCTLMGSEAEQEADFGVVVYSLIKM